MQMGRNITLRLEYDGQVDESDLREVAEEAVIKLDNVYRVDARLKDSGGGVVTARADFDEDGNKVLVEG